MNAATETLSPEPTAFPRVALFITDPAVLSELEAILREKYSSFMLVTDKAKLAEFAVPLIVLVDTIKDVADIRALGLVEGTQVLIVSQDGDSEIVGAAFDAGADDFVAYPFVPEAVLEKTEKYLAAFRT